MTFNQLQQSLIGLNNILNMIDFHNHILPGADDGAKTMEESIEMLHFAQKQGITDVVNTIHFQHPKMEGMNTDFDYVCSLRDELLKEMKKENISINIHLGAEVFFNFNLLDILDNPLITFGNGKYMLIEFQTLMMPEGYENHLYDLKMSGVTPIIAHPERYNFVQKDITVMEKWIDRGFVIQIDAGSIIGDFGSNCKNVSLDMISNNYVHLIGSDAHNNKKRNFCLLDAYEAIEDLTSLDYVIKLKENSKRILHGEKIIKINRVYKIKSKNKFNLKERLKNLFNFQLS